MKTFLAAALFSLVALPAAAADCPSGGPAAAVLPEIVAIMGGEPAGDCIFYGDYNGNGAQDALAFVYAYSGGNSVAQEVWLLSSDSGFWARVTQVEVYGQSPRDVRFSPGQILVTTDMPGPNDPRCCPSEETTWTLTIR